MSGVDDERTPAVAPHHIAYRRDIEGLRSLAIVPVVLDHLQVPGFLGGYVGVDIFFVISGYLITSGIVRDLAGGGFSIAAFYRRRILRIFPALFAMIAILLVAGIAFLTPHELGDLARSAFAATFFSSNILFHDQAGYFAAASATKPLLHTWSLAIEEQFYIFWPLILAALYNGRRGRLIWAVAIIAALSFAASWIGVMRDPTAAFYLLPARGWELLCGAAVALTTHRVRPGIATQAASVVAILVILGCIKRYTATTPFPGPAALLPCLAAAAIIHTGHTRTWVARLLALPPFTFFGRLSYSLYLWHWPVIVLTPLILFVEPSPLVAACQFLLSVALAFVSLHLIERPFRHRRRLPGRRALIAGGAALALVGGASAAIVADGGMPGRFTAHEQAIAAYEGQDHDALYRRGRCFLVAEGDAFDPGCLRATGKRPALLLLGDSNGAHLWPGLAAQAARFDVLQATYAGCKGVLYPVTDRRRCALFMRDVLTRWLPAHRVDHLVLASLWRPNELPLLWATLDLPAVRAASPILIGPVPRYKWPLPRLLIFADRRGDPGLVTRALEPEVATVDRDMAREAAARGVRYVSLVAAVCPGGHCFTQVAPGVPIQFDESHLTVLGSHWLVARIVDRLAE